MGRNKKDAAQDVLTLYNQMQEDETIERDKEEIRTTLDEIASAKELISSAMNLQKPIIQWNQRKSLLWLSKRVQRISLVVSAMPL